MGIATMAKKVADMAREAWNYDAAVQRQREAARELLARLPNLELSRKEAATEIEKVKTQIVAGDYPPNYLNRFLKSFNDISHEIQKTKTAKTFLVDSAPVELIVAFRKVKRELVEVSSRIACIKHNDLPEAERVQKQCQENLGLEKSNGVKPSPYKQFPSGFDISLTKLNESNAVLEALQRELAELSDRLPAIEKAVAEAREAMVQA